MDALDKKCEGKLTERLALWQAHTDFACLCLKEIKLPVKRCCAMWEDCERNPVGALDREYKGRLPKLLRRALRRSRGMLLVCVSMPLPRQGPTSTVLD